MEAAATEAPAEQAAPMAAAPAAMVAIEPRFINHPAPEFSTSLGAFTFGGCDPDSALCPPDSTIGQLGCQRVEGRDLLGGLTPPIPAAWCIYETGTPPNAQLYKYVADPYPHYRATIILNDGQYTLLNDPETLKAIYAPIDSPEEALSYALLLNDLEPRYDQGIVPGASYFSDVVEDTYITKAEQGYKMLLFSTEQTSDCERMVYAVNLTVTRDGQVFAINKLLQYLEQFC